ncbi:hypothetical protein OQJ02_13215 [Legionella sp. PATHC032]|uniref:hypothetical protein n=1 Tax=Legionella sp. PATHC032 TaxID=2992039 RepID=UPI001B2268C2|nr:hypothetical protein [Legionella sp. PATHC032]MCW8422590.1 hypothetical protein [Legionella sp. PATHC032]HAZ7572394.1 hypothetical protein [Legionella pneumophila]HBA1635531.1 hypothetical protein [Legionella pneumophila]
MFNNWHAATGDLSRVGLKKPHHPFSAIASFDQAIKIVNGDDRKSLVNTTLPTFAHTIAIVLFAIAPSTPVH